MNHDSSLTQPSAPSGTEAPALNRKTRRALEKHQRTGAKANAKAVKPQQSLASLEATIGALKTGFENVRVAFNKNHAAYAQALGAMDGHVAVMRAVINDVHRGDVQTDSEGNIDWSVYYEMYNEHIRQEQEATKTGEPKMSAEEADVEIFGGDHGSGV